MQHAGKLHACLLHAPGPSCTFVLGCKVSSAGLEARRDEAQKAVCICFFFAVFQAGAVRGLQAVRATVQTALEAAQQNELQEVGSCEKGAVKIRSRLLGYFMFHHVPPPLLRSQALRAVQGLARGEKIDDAPLARLLRRLFQRPQTLHCKLTTQKHFLLAKYRYVRVILAQGLC